jgi:hypothetical protein
MVSRTYLTIITGLIAAIWFSALRAQGSAVPSSFWSPLSLVVTALSVLLLVWDFHLWRLPFLHPWPVERPVLRGTWKGTFTGVGPGVPAGPRPIYFAVEQTFWSVRVRTFTTESRSASVVASLAELDGEFLLVSVYRNDPRLLLQDRSRSHAGVVSLWVHGPKPERLSGSYWTNRDTKGELELERVSAEIASDHDGAAALAEQDAARKRRAAGA